MGVFGFSAEIKKNTRKFLDFQQKSQKNSHGNPKFQKNPKFPKLLGAQKTFGNFGFPCVFLIFSRNPKKQNMEIFGFSVEIQKTHGNSWIFSRNPKKTKHGNFWVFSRNKKNTWKFLDFQQKSKKHIEILGFSAEIQKTHGNSWIFSRNPKKNKTWKFLGFQQK